MDKLAESVALEVYCIHFKGPETPSNGHNTSSNSSSRSKRRLRGLAVCKIALLGFVLGVMARLPNSIELQ